MVHNPNNWHWIDKNCLPWSRQYFEQTFLNQQFNASGTVLVIDGIESVTGDCDVTQRKGKVKCLFDMEMKFSFNSPSNESADNPESDKPAPDTSIAGTIDVSEFMHDMEEDELVISVNSDSLSPDTKKAFTNVLKKTLIQFQPDLLAAHEQDVKNST